VFQEWKGPEDRPSTIKSTDEELSSVMSSAPLTFRTSGTSSALVITGTSASTASGTTLCSATARFFLGSFLLGNFLSHSFLLLGVFPISRSEFFIFALVK
jgi:hypothetical protein